MIQRIKNKVSYWQDILERRAELRRFSAGHQVQLYNWSRPFSYDLWLVDFIEKRGLLAGNPRAKIALYCIFGPFWLSRFDGADARIFVERENLHKSTMQSWLHRFLDDDRVALSLGFDRLEHPQYMRFPFWLMWSVFSPTATYEEIRNQVAKMNDVDNHSFGDRKFCAFLRSHNDIGCKKIYDQFSAIGKVDCDGRLFHNNDDLKTIYKDDKLEYLRHYRFNLTPENTNQDGYVTEKLFEAIQCGCIPIYHGSDNHPEPDVLNQDAILFVEMGKENSDAVRLVADLNADEKRYMEFACQKRFTPQAADIIWGYYEELEKRLREIIANI